VPVTEKDRVLFADAEDEIENDNDPVSVVRFEGARVTKGDRDEILFEDEKIADFEGERLFVAVRQSDGDGERERQLDAVKD
jgi:hypothetical protein